jgi:protein-tyrosine phosphatase
VKASSNPTREELAELRSQGFSVIFSFLDERKQAARYDRKSTADAGWVVYSVPIAGGGTPSFDQLSEFIAFVSALPEGTRILMHCESGLGRTAFMAAAYWIANGLPADQAVERVRQAVSDGGWKTPQRESILREFARLRGSAVHR